MSPAAYGAQLALSAPPITDDQALEAARILASAPTNELSPRTQILP